ncbi:MAG TPA: alternative ribosome rescue aminoacyl-tRNA hydrolase ArfB [Drouetiella sp.]
MPGLQLSSGAEIPESEFEFTFARSGGPGGQNVNKVNSKAILHWNIEATTHVTYGCKQRFKEKFASRLTTDGLVVISSQEHRDQVTNVQECLEKLAAMLESVLTPPIARKATKIPKAVKVKRTESKREVGKKKQQRKSVDYDY